MTALDANGVRHGVRRDAASVRIEEPPVSALPGEELPKVFRARADAERRLREATTTGVIWAGMAAAMAVVVVGALIFRIDMVRLWPTTAGAYASVGLPVNTVGLVIENIKAEPSLEDGHAAVTITGVMRNITEHAVIAPPLRVELRNAKDKRVAGRIAAAADPRSRPARCATSPSLPEPAAHGQGPGHRLRGRARRRQGGENGPENLEAARGRTRTLPARGSRSRRRRTKRLDMNPRDMRPERRKPLPPTLTNPRIMNDQTQVPKS
jgi:hypothetical protein